MHCLPLALAILATAVAHPAPAYESGHGPAWIAAAGSTAKCESNSTLTVSFNQGPPQQTVLDNACAAMLPSCAYPERRGNDTACVQTFEYGLNAPASSIQSANVLENGDKSLKWSVKFSVIPHPADSSTQVNWSKADCLGYFTQLVGNASDQGGCLETTGSHIGNITVGGSGSLKGTVFDMKIVEDSSA